MSKSLYQFKINPEDAPQIQNMLYQVLPRYNYKPSKKNPRVFTCGSGWLTAKTRIEYKITGDLLSICIWKVAALILPAFEIGCVDANSFYGSILNDKMKKAVEQTINQISEKYPMTLLARCINVADNFLG